MMGPTGHEATDVKAGGLVFSLAMLVISVVVIHLVIYKVYRHLIASRTVLSVPVTVQRSEKRVRFETRTTDPPLQGTPFYPNYGHLEVSALHRQEDRVLNSYGWVDRERNIVHIPIRQAMQRLVAQDDVSQQKPADSPSEGIP